MPRHLASAATATTKSPTAAEAMTANEDEDQQQKSQQSQARTTPTFHPKQNRTVHAATGIEKGVFCLGVQWVVGMIAQHDVCTRASSLLHLI